MMRENELASAPDVGGWHRQVGDEGSYIRIAIERAGYPDGYVVSDQIPPHHLFAHVPALKKHLDGRTILLPAATCIDEDLVNDLVLAIVRADKTGSLCYMMAGEYGPVTAIKFHCIYTLFEMHNALETLRIHLWTLFGNEELKLGDVLWIWDHFGTKLNHDLYIAPHADEYLQMMAWQILNLDAEQKLNGEVREFIVTERSPQYLNNLLKERLEKFGLEKDVPVHIADGSRADVRNDQERTTSTEFDSPRLEITGAATKPSTPPSVITSASVLQQPPIAPSTSSQYIPTNSNQARARVATSVMQSSPTFISAGHMKLDEASMVDKSSPTISQFGFPEPRQDFWGGEATCAPHTATVKNVGWGFGTLKPSQPNVGTPSQPPSFGTPFKISSQSTDGANTSGSNASNRATFPSHMQQQQKQHLNPFNSQTQSTSQGFDFDKSIFQAPTASRSFPDTTEQSFSGYAMPNPSTDSAYGTSFAYNANDSDDRGGLDGSSKNSSTFQQHSGDNELDMSGMSFGGKARRILKPKGAREKKR